MADAAQPAPMHGRYQVSATLGCGQTVVAYTDDLAAARAAFDAAFAQPFAGDPDATGGIYDLATLTTVVSWRGGAVREPATDPMLAIADLLLASATPTLVAHGRRAVEFGGAKLAEEK